MEKSKIRKINKVLMIQAEKMITSLHKRIPKIIIRNMIFPKQISNKSQNNS